MAKFLYHLGKLCFRLKWIVVLLWVGILAAVGVSAVAFQDGFDDAFSIPDMPSSEAGQMMEHNFEGGVSPGFATDVDLVFQAPPGEKLADPKNHEAIQKVIDSLRADLPEAAEERTFGNPVDVNPKLIEGVVEQSVEKGLPRELAETNAYFLRVLSDDGTIGTTRFAFDAPAPGDVNQEQRDAVNKAIELGREAGITVEAGGPGFAEPIEVQSKSEMIGLGVALIVLLFTFGSVVAAGMPLITAVIGVGIGALGIVLGTAVVDLNNITPVLALMLGLAVGIDYALFILSRYRAELDEKGEEQSLEESAGMALGTAGSAVVFAGLTVIIALAALTLAKIPFLSWMGIAAAATVFVAVLIALTFIPALLGVLKGRVFGLKIPGLRSTKREAGPSYQRSSGLAYRYITKVQRYPALVLAAVTIGLSALSIPVTHLDLALPSDSVAERDTTQRKSAELLAEGFGEGKNAPFLVVMDVSDMNTQAAALSSYRAAAGIPEDAGVEQLAPLTYQMAAEKFNANADVAHAQVVRVNKAGTSAQILVTPRLGPNDPLSTELLHALRAQADDLRRSLGIEIGITGLTAVQQDVTTKLDHAMPIYLSVVVGLAIVLLLMVFRSLMVPLVAGLGFLLSVGAAFGTTILFWQQGLWGIVDTPGPIISFMPIFLIGVTFGLAMDYQVFLVTRMRERYIELQKHPEENTTPFSLVDASTVQGFLLGSRVVTAAALIMMAVFFANITQPLPFVKIFGFALGVAVLVDAFLIRMALVPATMFLLGRATWWMPRWLDRILPSLDVEGTSLEKEMESTASGRR
ncbi:MULTISPECIES: MMPL family transporter [unclassified Corynebacterium]|uniref:MMPL family transporter n=1 Tax=unclassified Corynebacterium TaxID=2624378 RepID=UPI001C4596DE|nr:MMPL family transporter [Corynebacterium sp. TAE3-ERU30]MBV7302259.1 MMPL family transporter [Corynebacterium sp. TAE3-ERU2]